MAADARYEVTIWVNVDAESDEHLDDILERLVQSLPPEIEWVNDSVFDTLS